MKPGKPVKQTVGNDRDWKAWEKIAEPIRNPAFYQIDIRIGDVLWTALNPLLQS